VPLTGGENAVKSLITSEPLTGAAAYFLSTLCDTIGLENEEKAIVANARGASIASASGGTKSKSSKDAVGENGHVRNKSSVNPSKMLTPNAVLATPIGLNAKTPVVNRFATPGTTGGDYKLLPWSGKITANLISNAFKPVTHKDLCVTISRGSVKGKGGANATVSGASAIAIDTKSMTTGNTSSFYEAFKEREANKKAMSIIYGDDKKLTWNCKSDNVWNMETPKNSTDAVKVYPTPPDEEAKNLKRKSVIRESFSSSAGSGKRVKLEGGRDCDVFWDFDRV
jgi:hypothetical protein